MAPESEKASVGDLDDLEADTGKITDGLTAATETGDEDLVVLVNETKTSILGDEAGDSLVVLFELHSDTLTDGGVGLLGLDTNLLDDDTGGVGAALEGLAPLSGLMSELVLLVGPAVESSLDTELASRVDSTWFMTSHFLLLMLMRYEI